MKKHCFSRNLKEDSELILAYREHHKKVWPEIVKYQK